MRDLYYTFVAPKMVEYRQDWDNLSDDICYAEKSPEAQARMDPGLRGRQRPANQLNAAEEEAHLSADHCAKVCAFGDEPEEVEEQADKDKDDGSWGFKIPDVLQGKNGAKRKQREKRLSRSCFQHRYSEGVCCTSKSFKLGAPRDVDAPPEKKWHSGWYLRGIQEWIDAKGDCEEVEWVKPRPM